jgi:nicotinamide-nucleotide amidase
MPAVVAELLLRQSATLALAESCTGGLLADWLTNLPGSSQYFVFSGVTYSNPAKVAVLGVSQKTLDRCGAVHEQTVREMAEGARRVAKTTYGLATSGIAGPDGGSADKPVGTVCIGLAGPDRCDARRFFFPFGRRLMNKKMFAMAALNMLRKTLST